MPASQQAAAAACREGIEAFQIAWLEWSRHRPELAHRIRTDRRGLTAPVHRLLTMPTTEEASRLGTLEHEDNEGGRSVRQIAVCASLPEAIAPEDFLHAARAGRAYGRTWLWPEAVCERHWPGHLERRWREAAGTGTGTPPAMSAVATRIRQAGIGRCIVWGAGEAGAALIKALGSEGVEVMLVTDSNPALWGTVLGGVEVVAPDDARRRGNHVFAIGSSAFADDIERILRKQYAAGTDEVRVFSPLAQVAA